MNAEKIKYLKVRITEAVLQDLTRAATLAETTIAEIVRSRIIMSPAETASEVLANGYATWAYNQRLIGAKKMAEIIAKVNREASPEARQYLAAQAEEEQKRESGWDVPLEPWEDLKV